MLLDEDRNIREGAETMRFDMSTEEGGLRLERVSNIC
jgi:hypothetical protein